MRALRKPAAGLVLLHGHTCIKPPLLGLLVYLLKSTDFLSVPFMRYMLFLVDRRHSHTTLKAGSKQ